MSYIQSFMQKLFQLSLCVSLLSLSPFSFSAGLNADSHSHHQSDLELGIELETNFWTLVKNHNIEKFSSKLAPIFQGLSISGIYTREQQITGLSAAAITSFEILNPVATRYQDTLVFSYDFVASGTGITNGPSLTVWKKKCNHSWKIVSHSYVPFVD